MDDWTGSAQVLTVGILDAGSITSNFGTIDIGSSAFTTTGIINVGTLTFSGTGTMNGLDVLDATSQTTINNIIDGNYLTNGNVDAKVVEHAATFIFSHDGDGVDGFIASSTAPIPIKNAITLQRFDCTATPNASSTVQFEWRSINNAWTAGTSTLSSELVSGGTYASTTSFAVTNIDADSVITPVIVSASSTNGDAVSCTIFWKVND